MNSLLTREKFKECVFERDGNKCIVCKALAVDAHHLLDRKLWSDGGYYLNNGVSLCEQHHIDAENCVFQIEELRDMAGIKEIVVPEGYDNTVMYDKWGKPMTLRYKHPRIFHFNWSDGLINDDKRVESTDAFKGKFVVATLKLDGENTTIYWDSYFHARSIDSKTHESRNVAKNLLSSIAYNLPVGWRMCVENMYAKHSIAYQDLKSYVYVHSIWNDNNVCLSVADTTEWSELLGLPYVPILYRGMYDEDALKRLYQPMHGNNEMEGYVVRLEDEIPYDVFSERVAKFVRKGHVQTSEHWMSQQIVPNKLL